MCRKFEVNTFNNSGVITFCNFLSTRGYSMQCNITLNSNTCNFVLQMCIKF